MRLDLQWQDPLALDVGFGYLQQQVKAPHQHHPRVVLNGADDSALRVLREQLAHADEFFFSVAFVSPRAIALLKQELVDFRGIGRIVTSDYLGFNSPAAFWELHNLQRLGIDVRIHRSKAFHPKGYVFRTGNLVTAMMGSSNLTEAALVTNHEWNLRVTAAGESDLAAQLASLVEAQVGESLPLTPGWIDEYSSTYVPVTRPRRMKEPRPGSREVADRTTTLVPNAMQQEALSSLGAVRSAGERRAIVISATGTGKTILSAFDVRAAAPRRVLFVVHREQIIDRTMEEYRRVLGGSPGDYGKLTGARKDSSSRYLFATVQTLSQPEVLSSFPADAFDYVIFDEAHRAASPSHRRVLDHFQPAFLLGMTATPERMDGFNVFELFDFNVPYEIRLNRALEEDMLCPFHYYGIADVELADGSRHRGGPDLSVLITSERVGHLIDALETYGQAGVEPRGLIFCSRRDEAIALSHALNARKLRGQALRTIALTGDDSVVAREDAVRRLEAGEIHYILTVDVFNEGVDIPSVNQIVMLRQTQSSIVFVQQLGRGLRKAPGKEYVVVLDFISNYANNYLIPIALFGDDSLNKESLRQHMIAAEEVGVLPGLASVRFDRISQERVLSSITEARLDSMQNLKKAIELMRNRLGRVPALHDFLSFESVDPVILATKSRSYPELIERVLKIPSGLDERQRQVLDLLSQEVLVCKRPQEFVLLRALLERGRLSREDAVATLRLAGVSSSDHVLDSAMETLTLEQHSEVDQKRYARGLVSPEGGAFVLDPNVLDAYRRDAAFHLAVDDVLVTGAELVKRRYAAGDPFVPGWQYSRKETARLLCWPRKWTSTIYGYRVDGRTAQCAIFVTLHKADDVAASTAYEDELLDPSTMRWYTRSRRTLQSDEVRAIVNHEVDLHVFVKKDDAEGVDFYYLGRARSEAPVQTTMPDSAGNPLDVVRMLLRFDSPVPSALFDYFHPVVTERV